MIYKKENGINNFRILGEEFVRNNKNKGILIINNKKMKFPKKGIVSYNDFKQNKILMMLKNNIFNKSCLFKNCELLESLTFFLTNDKTNLGNNMNNKNYKNNIEGYSFYFKRNVF